MEKKMFTCTFCGENLIKEYIEGSFSCPNCKEKDFKEVEAVIPKFSKACYWQRCPICEGSGYLTLNGYSTSVTSQCDVCNGKKIISTLNGLPPQ